MFSKSIIFLLCCVISICFAAKEKKDRETKPEEKWKKKDVTDYSEADLERLYEQWEDNDPDELEEDELPEHKRKPPPIDMSKLDMKNPESIVSASKKGRTLMMFVTVSGNPTEKETEQITQLWQSSLFNLHIDAQRYIIGANRALFVLTDGGRAIEVKNFLVEQDRCALVTIEQRDYPGKGASQEDLDKAKGVTGKKTEL